jgi:hypothetical protein
MESNTKKYYVSKAIRIEVSDESIKLKDGAKYGDIKNILDICEYSIDEIIEYDLITDKKKVIENPYKLN